METGCAPLKIVKSKAVHVLKYVPAAAGSCLMAFLLLLMPEKAAEGVRRGLDICAASVIPSLFPFMALSSFLIHSRLCLWRGRIADTLGKKLFSLPGSALSAVFMSLIGGFPVGASMTAKLLEKGEITKNQAQRMMLFCVNAGPAFIIGTVGVSMLSSVAAGAVILVSLLTSSLAMGFFSNLIADGQYAPAESERGEDRADFPQAFTKAVADAASSMFSICAWVILFSCLNGFTDLMSIGESGKIFIKGVLEVTTGSFAAAGKVPLPIMCLIIGFSGICVHCQIMNCVIETGIKPSLFIAARIINGAIAAIICSVILEFFPLSAQAMSNAVNTVPQAYSASIPAAAGLMIMGGLLILELDSKRKIC